MAGENREEPSFDPRTWRAVSGEPPRTEAPASAPPPRPQAGSRRNLLLGAGAAAGALALVGAGATLIQKRRRPAPAASAPRDDAQQRAFILSDPRELESALAGAGAPPADAKAVAESAAGALGAAPGELHVAMTLSAGVPARLVSLRLRRADGTGATVLPDGRGGFAAKAEAAQLTARAKVVRGEMDADSFYTSAVAAGVTDSLISPFANAFAFDFDFQREIQKGDVFEAVFERRIDDQGQVVGPERLLFALLETRTRSRALYRFEPAGQAEGWFDANGRSIVRALMRTPVDGARVSSTFGMREHPVLGFMKMHKGIDFASPVGTPIFSAGDGAVEFAGPKGPNGNFVQIRHDNGWETLYLHLSAFAPDVATGARVRQGQQIGQVGTTGRSTGPHLHYEVHINGEAVDPMSITTDQGRALSGLVLKAFARERDRIDALRAQQTGA